jgi:hypothetical protein
MPCTIAAATTGSSTPSGTKTASECPIGFAWVTFTEADTPACRLATCRGVRQRSEHGATIAAPTTDYEPAIAWATAFAGVRQAAGHGCSVTHAID